jgi:hypothetical protein
MFIFLRTISLIVGITLCGPTYSAPPTAPPAPQKNDLLSNNISGQVDEVAKPSVRQILERQTNVGEGIASAISPENYAKLEKLYSLQQYASISDFLGHYLGDRNADEWVKRKANDGSVPMMWLLAERYASVKTIDLAIKWGYTALLGTMQERALCLDPETEFAAAKFSSLHPRILEADHANPFSAKEAKLFAMSVLANANKYQDPIPWLCQPFSSRSRLKTPGVPFAFDALYFPHLRAKARNALRTKYKIAQPAETLPPLPKPATPSTH